MCVFVCWSSILWLSSILLQISKLISSCKNCLKKYIKTLCHSCGAFQMLVICTNLSNWSAIWLNVVLNPTFNSPEEEEDGDMVGLAGKWLTWIVCSLQHPVHCTLECYLCQYCHLCVNTGACWKLTLPLNPVIKLIIKTLTIMCISLLE